MSSVHALPSLSRRCPLPRPTSVSNSIQASVTPSALGGRLGRGPVARLGVRERVVEHVLDAGRPLDGLEVPRERDEVAPVAVVEEQLGGGRAVTRGQRLVEAREPLLDLGGRGLDGGVGHLSSCAQTGPRHCCRLGCPHGGQRPTLRGPARARGPRPRGGRAARRRGRLRPARGDGRRAALVRGGDQPRVRRRAGAGAGRRRGGAGPARQRRRRRRALGAGDRRAARPRGPRGRRARPVRGRGRPVRGRHARGPGARLRGLRRDGRGAGCGRSARRSRRPTGSARSRSSTAPARCRWASRA